MSSIVLAVGNGKTLFGGAGVAPDADLVRFVDPESPIINAFDLCALGAVLAKVGNLSNT